MINDVRPFDVGRMRRQLHRTGPKTAAARITADALLGIGAPLMKGDEMKAERDRWRRVAEYGWQLHSYGECAPGGRETWREYERMIRSAADGGTPQ